MTRKRRLQQNPTKVLKSLRQCQRISVPCKAEAALCRQPRANFSSRGLARILARYAYIPVLGRKRRPILLMRKHSRSDGISLLVQADMSLTRRKVVSY